MSPTPAALIREDPNAGHWYGDHARVTMTLDFFDAYLKWRDVAPSTQ